MLYPERGKKAKGRLGSLMKKHNRRCVYCEREVFMKKPPYATIDHVIPKSKGGKDVVANRVLACHSCNFMKSNTSKEDFLKELYLLTEAINRKVKKMEEEEKQSYLHGGNNAAEYMKSIGKHDLATLSGDEWLTFCKCMCKNYHSKFIELTGQKNLDMNLFNKTFDN